MNKKFKLILIGCITTNIINIQAAIAQKASPPPEVDININNAIGTLLVLHPLAEKTLAVALLPLAAFLTITFIQKVMSRI